ncbi:MAG: hypothetical protein ACQEWU_07145 [Bacillota bacterium]|uniref:Uncharacterized protein n=1 Tax=Virgibacillus salarius TaxID=447199 RepID=A0A941DZ80_9BACI|nr:MULTISPECIES: hypothetical protein [Virgibacillus]NAZ10766.1 hypothetical protein [Agaribacter marinus]MBR7798057.1 hypothetical protein [Virgibacillus salarius]MCC2250733.1 hypothetical protein [Virgibacillus sp. AGTR]QRZ17224.1 hypothetical protein JUJ52_15780 [Virgibacillus sp. AGTR]WBX79455.1 hypothetical protein PD280_17370 [Virgibacillus salarius]
MQELLQSFLEDEISDQEFYDGIIDFVYSFNIRSGEYECNRFVIKKMDHLNFIIFDEYVIDDKREIHNSVSIHKNKFIKLVNEFAKKQGIIIRSSF